MSFAPDLYKFVGRFFRTDFGIVLVTGILNQTGHFYPVRISRMSSSGFLADDGLSEEYALRTFGTESEASIQEAIQEGFWIDPRDIVRMKK